MAIRLRSLAIKFSSSAHLTRTTTYSCYNVIKPSPIPNINSFITNKTTFSPSYHTRNYSCYNVITDFLEPDINSLVTKGENSININQDLKKVSMENIIKKYLKQVLNGVVILDLDFSFLYDHDHDNHNVRLAFASSGGSMGGSNFSRGGSSLSSISSSSSYSYGHSSCGSNGSDGGGAGIVFFCILLLVLFFIIIANQSHDTSYPKNSVIKLQVGLLGTARSLQKDLNTICKTADTSGEAGYRYILQETAAALIRNPDYCVTGSSSVDVNRDIEESEKLYRRLFMEERLKMDELTLVNVNNIKKKKATGGRYNAFGSDYIVITIIVCANGVHRIPPIRNREEFKEALKTLASIPNKIMGVEVLWTPQMKDDVLTKEEMFENYPQLEPFHETIEKVSI